MKIAICGYYGMGNIGDEAILKGLRLTVSKIWPNSEIVVMGRDNLFPVGIRSFFKALIRPRSFLKPYRTVKSCNVFILGGGGLFTDEEGPFVSLFWALQGLIAHALGKPVLCLGISVGKIGFLNKIFVKKLFKIAKIILVRDKSSYEFITKWGIKCHLGSDFATVIASEAKQSTTDSRLLRQPTFRRLLRNDNNYIVISMRRFKNLDEKLYTKLAQFCDLIIEKYGLSIKLIPFQSEDKNDSIVLNKIFEQAKQKEKISVDKFYDDINKLITIFANAKIVIAMRLHAGILSAISGTPFIPLSYMGKVNAFWQEFPDIKIINLSEMTTEQLFARFSEMYSDYYNQKTLIDNIQKSLLERTKITEGILLQRLNIK